MDATTKQAALDIPEVVSENTIQQDLVKIWESVFEQSISTDDDFFELGGDSIKAMALVSKINRRFGVLLQIEEIFEDGSFDYQINRIQGVQSPSTENIKRAPVQEFYPLSNTQKGFFALSHINPETVSCNIPIVYKVYGGMDLALAKNSMREIIRRHEILRTSFRIEGSKVVQEVLDKVEFDIPTVERGDRSIREVVESLVKPHNLEAPPLFRVMAIMVEGEVKFLLFDSHHIISDLISLNLFLKEFFLLYRGEPLTPLKNQYKDFAYWQQERMSEVKIKNRDFWLEAFDEVPPKINLPVATETLETYKYNGDTYKFEFDHHEIIELREVCKKEKVSQFTFMMSLFYAFLYKISNQTDLVVGLTSHGRNVPEFHNLIGVFVNTLPVRTQVDPNLSFLDFVHQFKTEIPKYFANQDFPYDSVLQELRAKNLIQNRGLFNVMFEHHQVDWQDPKLNLVDRPLLAPKCDLAFQVGNKVAGEQGAEIILFVEFNKNIFKRETIKILSKYFSSLVEELTTNINTKISDLGDYEAFKNGPYELQEKFHKIDLRHEL